MLIVGMHDWYLSKQQETWGNNVQTLDVKNLGLTARLEDCKSRIAQNSGLVLGYNILVTNKTCALLIFGVN